jgi:nucleoside-diphosphate-sugar epimerase
MFEGKKVLVTGGMGFIGSNLSRRLVELGAEVTIVDNMDPSGGANTFNISDIESNLALTVGDVKDKLAMKWCIVGQDYIFNLAGQTSHQDSMTYPYRDLEINTCAQLTLLELCREYNRDVKIVFASTRQLYGRPRYLPVDEKHPVNPIDVNGINKWAGERYHILYNNIYGIKSSVLRLTNTYGPGMRIKDSRQMFLGIWIKLILEGTPFEVWEGHHLRDFTYVDDVVDAFLLAAKNEKANGQTYNLGGYRISLKMLGEMLIEINTKGKYIEKELPLERKKIDIGDYYSDYTKIKTELGWVPKIGLYEGLGRTLDYYKKNYREYI